MDNTKFEEKRERKTEKPIDILYMCHLGRRRMPRHIK
jgi:hypothetical protein